MSLTDRTRLLGPVRIHAEAQVPGPSGAFEQGREAESRRGLFNRIAPVYDQAGPHPLGHPHRGSPCPPRNQTRLPQLNDVLSFGQHRVWKRCAVAWCGAKPGHRALDVCCGSGDLTFLLAERVGKDGSAVGLDFAEDILRFAAKKQEERPPVSWYLNQKIEWRQGVGRIVPAFLALHPSAAPSGPLPRHPRRMP